jgi:hypothetical protein
VRQAARGGLGRLSRWGWAWPLAPLLALPFLFTGALASLSEEASATLAGVLLVLWPGWALAEWAGWGRGLSRVQRLPLWFALSLLLAMPATLAVTLLHLTVRAFTALTLALAALLALGAGLRRRGPRIEAPRVAEGKVGIRPVAFVAWALALSAFAFVAVRAGPRDSDSLAYLGHIQERLAASRLEPRDPFLGLDEWGVSPRLWFSPWLFLQAGIADLGQADAVNLVFTYLPPWLALLSLAALYGLARAILPRDAALAAVSLQILLYASSLQIHEGPGRAFFARVAEDKMLMWLVLMPLALRFGLRFLGGGPRADFLLYGLITVAATVIHPLGLVLVGLFAGSVGAAAFFPPRLDRWRRALVLLLPPFFLVPYVLYERLAERGVPFDVAGSGAALDFRLALSADRLLILPNGWYLAHPALLRNGLILAGLSLAFLAARDLPHSLAARFLVATTLIPLALIYNPFTAVLVGRIISPWLLWRITWLPPFALAATYALWRARPLLRGALASGLVAAFLLSDPAASYTVWQGGNIWLPPLDRAFLEAARPYVADDGVVLAPATLNRLIPAMWPRARVVEFRGSAQAPDRRAAVDAFYAQEELQGAQLAILRRYEVRYAILPTRSPLASGVAHLPSLWRPLYRDAIWTLYALPPLGAETERATARQILSDLVFWTGDADRALRIYGDALGLPLPPVMRHWAEGEALRARGEIAGALAAYRAMAEAAQEAGDADALAEAMARVQRLQADLQNLTEAEGDEEGSRAARWAEEYGRQAEALALEGRMGEAEAAMRLAAQLTKAARAAYRHRWETLRREGQWDKAQEVEQDLLAFEEEVEAWGGAVARAVESREVSRPLTRPAQAVLALAEELARSPAPYRETGDLLAGQGAWAEALAFYDRALARAPWDAAARSALADVAARWLRSASPPPWARNELQEANLPQTVALEAGATYLYAASLRRAGRGAALRWEYLLAGEAVPGGEEPFSETAPAHAATIFTVPPEATTVIVSLVASGGDAPQPEEARLTRLPLRSRLPVIPSPYVRLGEQRLARGDEAAAALAYARALAAEPMNGDALDGLARALSRSASIVGDAADAARQALAGTLDALAEAALTKPEDEETRQRLAIAADLYLDVGGALGGPNLIASPDFAGRGWRIYNPDRRARHGAEPPEARGEARGGWMESAAPGYHGGYYQYRPVEPGATYLFAFSLRAEDQGGLTVRLGYWDYEKEGGRVSAIAGPTLTGSIPWTRYRFLIQIPQDVRGVSFYPALFFNAGRVWLDEVRVVRLPPLQP